jgi:hypothetical protein
MKYRQYRHGVRLSGYVRNDHPAPPLRVAISAFSESSRRLLQWRFQQGPWKSMITLTYHNNWPNDYKTAKRQLNAWLQAVRRRGIDYLWVVEFQVRGAPHYHVWLDREFDNVDTWNDFESDGKVERVDNEKSWRPLMKVWLRVSGQENDKEAESFGLHKSSYTNWDVSVKSNYAAKYASKNIQKGLPSGCKGFGRWWGNSRGMVFETQQYESDTIGDTREDAIIMRDEFQFRRQVKRFIERKSNYKFPRDPVGSLRPIRWIMPADQVLCISRLRNYYLRKSGVNEKCRVKHGQEAPAMEWVLTS